MISARWSQARPLRALNLVPRPAARRAWAYMTPSRGSKAPPSNARDARQHLQYTGARRGLRRVASFGKAPLPGSLSTERQWQSAFPELAGGAPAPAPAPEPEPEPEEPEPEELQSDQATGTDGVSLAAAMTATAAALLHLVS